MYSEEMPDADTAAEHVHTLKMNALEETTLNVALESLYDEDKVAYVQDMVDGDFAKITPVNWCNKLIILRCFDKILYMVI